MKKLIVTVAITFLLVFGVASPVFAATYTGWDQIRPALQGGNGADFIVSGPSYPTFSGSEWEKVTAANTWVHDHIIYTAESVETWRSSDSIFGDIDSYGQAYDDCEEYAILLCAIMRFSIDVPADRVWVEAGVTPRAAGHAWVGYRTPTGILVHLDPTWDTYYVGSIGGGMLRFNDQWVKGGGYLLNNPNLL
jgi:hypothetical protein